MHPTLESEMSVSLRMLLGIQLTGFNNFAATTLAQSSNKATSDVSFASLVTSRDLAASSPPLPAGVGSL